MLSNSTALLRKAEACSPWSSLCQLHSDVVVAFFPDSAIEHLVIELDADDAKLLVLNFYIPPTSSVPGFTPNLNPLFDITRDVLIMGEFNAHDAR